jgi:hypothetical protein
MDIACDFEDGDNLMQYDFCDEWARWCSETESNLILREGKQNEI